MAEEPSAKCHHGETSGKSCNLDDVDVPDEKRAYTRTLIGVELHGKETMEIVCTSELDKADEMMSKLRMKGGGLYPSFIGVDVKPKRLKEFLQEEKLYTFAGFSIEGDMRMLNKSGLEVNLNNFIDMQRKWKVPTNNKFYDSFADVAGSVVHPFYKGMKKKIDTEEDHKLWGISPLPDKLIEYAGVDAYGTYKSWKIIDNIVTGWDISKEQEADTYYHCNFAG
ncbi:uncharacterized protein [Aegilops tauschii subsp. strangulata]|uniref:uncharacterized protein n=1 Tax=Aegilops tauschii subsp. strangulata TaxID=200361 RepID=UPI003CC8CF16